MKFIFKINNDDNDNTTITTTNNNKVNASLRTGNDQCKGNQYVL